MVGGFLRKVRKIVFSLFKLRRLKKNNLQKEWRKKLFYYLQRSYPSEYKRYSPNAFIIISIEDSLSSMPHPAPQPQEQPPQVPRPPQDAVVQNIVASATPAGDTPTTPDQLEVHVVLAFPLSFYTFLFCTSSDRFVAPVTLVVFYPLRFSLY